jgi:hypothetical protein
LVNKTTLQNVQMPHLQSMLLNRGLFCWGAKLLISLMDVGTSGPQRGGIGTDLKVLRIRVK